MLLAVTAVESTIMTECDPIGSVTKLIVRLEPETI